MSNTLYKDHGVFLFFFFFFSFSILYHSQQPVSEPPMPWGQFLLSQRHSLYLRITCTRGQQQKEWWDFLQNSDFSVFLVLVSHYAVIRVLFTVLESFVLPMWWVTLCTKIMACSFFSFFFSFSILYHQSQQPVSEPPMPWGQFLLSQRHSLYLRIICTRGQQQKEWWDFLQYGDFSIFLVLVSHYAVIRVLFTVLESFVLRHLLKSYTSKVNKTL